MFHLHLGDYQHISFGILLHGSFIYSLPCAYLFDHLFVSVLTHGGLFYVLFYYVYITYLHIFIYIHFITYYIYLVYFIYIYFTIISLSIFILRHDKSWTRCLVIKLLSDWLPLRFDMANKMPYHNEVPPEKNLFSFPVAGEREERIICSMLAVLHNKVSYCLPPLALNGISFMSVLNYMS